MIIKSHFLILHKNNLFYTKIMTTSVLICKNCTVHLITPNRSFVLIDFFIIIILTRKMPLNFKPHCCSPAIDRTFLFSIVKHSPIPSEPVSLRLYLTHAYKGRSCYWRRRKIQTTICSSCFPRISPLGMVDIHFSPPSLELPR